MISLEVAVLERVVFDLDRESLVRHVVRRALWHRPRSQHAVHLQPQVEMEIPRGVLVDDEQIPGSTAGPPNGSGVRSETAWRDRY